MRGNRTRMVNFRLSEDEVRRVERALRSSDARSFSDFARTALIEKLDAEDGRIAPSNQQMETLNQRLTKIDQKLDNLADKMRTSNPIARASRVQPHAH